MFKVWFIATAIGSSSGGPAPTIETTKIEFTKGIDLMGKCRKFEQQYHLGNGSIASRGNKLVSNFYPVSGGKRVTIETMCLEQE